MALKLRLKCFDCCITPVVLFGLSVLPLTASHLQKLDALQRRMLRSDYSAGSGLGMRTGMKHVRYGCRQKCAPWQSTWSKQWEQLHSLAHRVASHSWGKFAVLWTPRDEWENNFPRKLHRKPGRPALRWDNRLKDFCQQYFPTCSSWIDGASHMN